MEVIFTPHALEDIDYWKQKRNDKILSRIKELIKAIQTDSFAALANLNH